MDFNIQVQTKHSTHKIWLIRMSRPLKKESCDEIHTFTVCPSINRGGGIRGLYPCWPPHSIPKTVLLCHDLCPHKDWLPNCVSLHICQIARHPCQFDSPSPCHTLRQYCSQFTLDRLAVGETHWERHAKDRSLPCVTSWEMLFCQCSTFPALVGIFLLSGGPSTCPIWPVCLGDHKPFFWTASGQ